MRSVFTWSRIPSVDFKECSLSSLFSAYKSLMLKDIFLGAEFSKDLHSDRAFLIRQSLCQIAVWERMLFCFEGTNAALLKCQGVNSKICISLHFYTAVLLPSFHREFPYTVVVHITICFFGYFLMILIYMLGVFLLSLGFNYSMEEVLTGLCCVQNQADSQYKG